MTKYSKEYAITFRDTDKNGNLRMNSLVDFMQDIARQDATALGVDFEQTNKNYYWIIIRTQINMICTPKIDEIIRIETFPSGTEKLYAVREFHIYDQNDQKLGSIIGYYLMMEHGNPRPVNIKKALASSAFHTEYTGEKIEKLMPSNDQVEKELTRRVYSSDIDGNGHMNNAHYIRWCFDMYETSELDSHTTSSFQIQYMKEVLEGEWISLTRYRDGYIVGECENTIHFIAKIEFN